MDNNDSSTFGHKQLTTLQEFDRTDTYFRFPGNLRITGTRLEAIGIQSIGISAIQSNLSITDFDSFTQVVSNLTNSLAIITIFQFVTALNMYYKKVGTNEITIDGLSFFYELCRTHKIGFSNFGNLRRLLTHWHQLGRPGVDDDIIDFLSPIKKPQPKRSGGSRIRSDNVEEGWYTDDEYTMLVSRIWSSYEIKEISLHKATLLLLSAQYGRRPVQIAHLKIGDLKSTGKSCGVSGKRIEFPGAKDLSSPDFRQSKIEVHPVGDDLWRLCQLQMNDSVKRFQTFLGRKLKPEVIKLLPLFPTQRPKLLQKKIELSTQLTTSAEDMLGSEILHPSPSSISTMIKRGPGRDPIISERTGLSLNQNSYRNRYTRARQLARMGVPKTTLQYWLGHTSLISLDAYYDDPAERARMLNDQIAPLMAPLSQAFQGTLRNKEADAVRSDDPVSRIELDGREELEVGTCGEHGFCTASVPIPCYRCIHFQPWIYGPHHEVLKRLLERQKLENEIPRPNQGRRLLVPVQLDNDIKAVKVVIALCENRKKLLEDTQ
ncbi:TPA: hypothetical protein EYP66_15570 [Candidatus Poribacteria bacterium]|nr:hypothetical protein [Candidatus Poribacteria bacterium]